MKRLLQRIFIVSIVLAALSAFPSLAQTPSPSADSRPKTNRRQGFFDYVLGKVNPSGNDYGAALQSGRDSMVGNTVDDLYFWSNAVTLVLLTGSVAIVFLQWRSEAKREIIAAALIAELWNGRVSDRVELDRRTAQFNELAAAHNVEVERALTLSQQQAEKQSAGNLNRSVRKLSEAPTGASPKDAPRVTTAPEAPVASPPDASVANLQQSNVLLQRRIEAMQNTKQNLEQRLSQTAALLEQERRRNATLKGA
ncbi:hypothetical protein [Acidicapsa ligni]|uniref:hypothetical protein n=1 Tax=Acidicapsa ligni TaxID=542300 RepID=UPI0021DF70C5|nr:hypothetical protein [Acidicapsa ligni]